MSFTNTTTHYSLPQYVATDKPKYLTDFNETMADIDAQMYANAQAAATADDKAVAAKDIADGAVSSIGTLNTQINGDTSDPTDRGLAGDVSDNSGAINTINSLIGNGTPTTTDHTIIGAINELNAKPSRTLRKRLIGDGVKTTSDLLDELYTTFAGLTDAELSNAALLTTQSSGKSNFIYQGGSLTSFLIARTTSAGNVVMEVKETGSTSILYKLDGTTQDYSANVILEGYTYSIYA